MGENSKVEWTTHTWNPWHGCTKVDPKCKNCYAEAMSKRWGRDIWGPLADRMPLSEANWKLPFKWNREIYKCDICGSLLAVDPDLSIDTPDGISTWCKTCHHTRFCTKVRPRVFCASMADVFESAETCQNVDAYLMIQRERLRLLGVIRKTPNLDWLLLTKRPQNIRQIIEFAVPRVQFNPDHYEDYLAVPGDSLSNWLRRWLAGRPPHNVWLGTSNEGQSQVLAEVPAVVHFLSIEPLLGPPGTLDLRGIEWVITGGESGAGARPMHPDWARSVRNQCVDAGVPFFFKQWGEWGLGSQIGGSCEIVLNDGRHAKGSSLFDQDTKNNWNRYAATMMARVGKKEAGRLLDDREWNEFPEAKA